MKEVFVEEIFVAWLIKPQKFIPTKTPKFPKLSKNLINSLSKWFFQIQWKNTIKFIVLWKSGILFVTQWGLSKDLNFYNFLKPQKFLFSLAVLLWTEKPILQTRSSVKEESVCGIGLKYFQIRNKLITFDDWDISCRCQHIYRHLTTNFHFSLALYYKEQ